MLPGRRLKLKAHGPDTGSCCSHLDCFRGSLVGALVAGKMPPDLVPAAQAGKYAGRGALCRYRSQELLLLKRRAGSGSFLGLEVIAAAYFFGIYW